MSMVDQARQVWLAEQQGVWMAAVIRAVLCDPQVGLSRRQVEAGLRAAARHLAALGGCPQ